MKSNMRGVVVYSAWPWDEDGDQKDEDQGSTNDDPEPSEPEEGSTDDSLENAE